MKIGILTFHRAHNYGAVLQCYALQETLKSMGHEVWIIDYRQPMIDKAYKVLDLRKMAKYILLLKKDIFPYIRHIPERIIRKHNFEHFVDSHLHLTKKATINNMPQDLDCYLVGSDQMWNWLVLLNKIDYVYLGQFLRPEGSKLVGYAISGNLGSLEKLGFGYLKKVLNDFDAISFREESLSKVIDCLTGIKTPVCCDPTLLTDAKFWDKLASDKYKNRKFVFAYQVGRLPKQKNFLRDKAKKLANQLGCEVIFVDAKDSLPSVPDLLSMFKYAQYVVATSFHGTVFPIIFEHPFYTFKLRHGADERYEALTSFLGIPQCCVDMDFTPVPQNIDFTPVRKKLIELRQQSEEFLREIK